MTATKWPEIRAQRCTPKELRQIDQEVERELLDLRALEAHASPAERQWIEALTVRYSPDPKADRKVLDEAFAQAMGRYVWAAGRIA